MEAFLMIGSVVGLVLILTHSAPILSEAGSLLGAGKCLVPARGEFMPSLPSARDLRCLRYEAAGFDSLSSITQIEHREASNKIMIIQPAMDFTGLRATIVIGVGERAFQNEGARE